MKSVSALVLQLGEDSMVSAVKNRRYRGVVGNINTVTESYHWCCGAIWYVGHLNDEYRNVNTTRSSSNGAYAGEKKLLW